MTFFDAASSRYKTSCRIAMFRLITIGLSGAVTCTQPAKLADKATTVIDVKANIFFPMSRRIALSMRFVNCRCVCGMPAFPFLNSLFILSLIFLFGFYFPRRGRFAVALLHQERQRLIGCILRIVKPAYRTDKLQKFCLDADVELDRNAR